MLFNSYAFIFVYLPVTCLGFFLIARVSTRMAAAWLVACSLVFYGWWDPKYVLLLVASITFNFFAGRLIFRLKASGAHRASSAALALALTADLGLLAYYKYIGFFLHNVSVLFGLDWAIGSVILPLGISFFTFTQVAFLVDTWRGEVKSFNPLHYALFVTYFPHLIAGPILHHREMIPQFAMPSMYRFRTENAAVGITVFAIGLFKKVVLADSIAKYADPVFSGAHLASLTVVDAWAGALAYTMQIYFDFSGYSDMAIGLSMLFGVRIPLNFNSPYKAENIVEFWRRWHISLSRFLLNYLYIPIGGNRNGSARRYANLMITMLLGGLWHGAGWTFVIWGALHGIYLIVNHGWSAMTKRAGDGIHRSVVWRWSARLLTFLAVVLAWVFFRADSLETALGILKGMLGMNGVVLPVSYAPSLGFLAPWLVEHGVRFEFMPLLEGKPQIALTVLLLFTVWFLPNTQQLMGRIQIALGEVSPLKGFWGKFAWEPSLKYALVISGMLSASLVTMYFAANSEFIYYNF